MQLKDKKLFIFDMDGVLYRHTTPIPAAIDVVKQLKNKGKKVTFLTNNSTKTQEQFVQKLKKMGLTVKPKSIYTSATITSEMLSKNYDGNTVYVIGEDGLKQALKEEGFILLNEMRPNLEE